MSVAVHRDALEGAPLERERPLVWRRVVPLGSEFELLQDGRVFGEMEPAGRPAADAFGECLGQPLEIALERRWLAWKSIEIRTAFPPRGEAGPSFSGPFFGFGTLVTPAGETLSWRLSFLRMYHHVLRDASGGELLRLRPSFLRFGRTETRVLVTPAGWAREDLPTLLLVTWFLRAHAESWRRVFGRSRGPGLTAPDHPSLPP